jgi:ferredoxin
VCRACEGARRCGSCRAKVLTKVTCLLSGIGATPSDVSRTTTVPLTFILDTCEPSTYLLPRMIEKSKSCDPYDG